MTAEIDSRGNVTRYTVEAETSQVTETEDRCGNRKQYTYDSQGRLSGQSDCQPGGTTIASVTYGYDACESLTAITRGDGQAYEMTYNSFHQLTGIGIATATPLVSYTYKNGNGRLKEIAYANGSRAHLTYNSLGQVVAERWTTAAGEEEAVYRYVYDGSGNLVRSLDEKQAKVYDYTYEGGRLVRSTESRVTRNEAGQITGKTVLGSVRYSYDADGNLVKKRIEDSTGAAAAYTYEKGDNDSPVVKLPTGVVSHSRTDTFGRKAFDELQLGKGFLSRQYSYHAGQATSTHIAQGKLKSSPTTNLVQRITYADGRTLDYAS